MFRQFRSEVADALGDALASLDLPTDDLGIERPPDDMDATLASSVAFRLAGEVGDAPPNVAATVADAVDVDGYDYLAAVDTAGPYVNFHPGERYFVDTLDASAVDSGYGALPDRDTSVVVEHTSANPTGPVHVGRARNPIVGDAVANLLEYAGYDVDRHYYVNDAGRQMAVFTWAYERFDESDLAGEPARARAEYDLVRYYRKGNAYLEEADPEAVEAAEEEIAAILQGLEAGDEETYERVGEVVDTVLGGMKECLARLPAEFDEFVKETRFMRDGSTDDIAARLKETDHAVYEEDAWQLELDDWGSTRTSSSCAPTIPASTPPAIWPTTSGSSTTTTARSPYSARTTSCRPTSSTRPSNCSVTTSTGSATSSTRTSTSRTGRCLPGGVPA